MGDITLLQQEATKKIKLADHMLTQTYPLVKDTRLFLTILENVFLSLQTSMSSLLFVEKYYNQIPPFDNTFKSRFDIFRYHLVDKYGIDRAYLLLIKDIESIITEHKKSSVEFARKSKFVICTESYRTYELTSEKLKKFIIQTQEFINIINKVVDQNGRIR